MKRTTNCIRTALGIALAVALVPGPALAAQGPLEAAKLGTPLIEQLQEEIAGQVEAASDAAHAKAGVERSADATVLETITAATAAAQAEAEARAQARAQAEADRLAGNKLLSYDPADIAAIGTQAASGHTICCPSFSCAYADAVMDGTVHDHSYYTCSTCSWTDWGGGNSSFRCVGADEQLLREAYDQIAHGRPTVIHVRASYGEHWIALIGYEGATDPDHLTLANFIALDPWDGAQLNAASRFSLYGDGCEHISQR